MKLSRAFCFPSSDTFDCPPIKDFVCAHLRSSQISVDPFARNNQWATFTNDLNQNTKASFHLDAIEFLTNLHEIDGICPDVVILDPPYSPRQVKECYAIAGLPMTQSDGWTANYMKKLRQAVDRMTLPRAIAMTFGWNSCSMGTQWEIVEILLVNHGGAHNDTICTAQVKRSHQTSLDFPSNL